METLQLSSVTISIGMNSLTLPKVVITFMFSPMLKDVIAW